MRNGVRFGEKHSIDNWDLIMTAKEIGIPEPRKKEVEIPGRDGALEIPDPSGEIKYNNRTISFSFDTLKPSSDWWNLDREIMNYLHGRKLKVTLDQDAEYYYLASLKKESFTNDKNVGHFTISGIAEPYKYKQDITEVSYTVAAGSTYTFVNDRRSVVPTLNLSAAMTIEFEGTSYSLSSGTQKVPGIRFKEGNNLIKVITGSGTLKATYQEASL